MDVFLFALHIASLQRVLSQYSYLPFTSRLYKESFHIAALHKVGVGVVLSHDKLKVW
jgi:hypothetical protein